MIRVCGHVCQPSSLSMKLLGVDFISKQERACRIWDYQHQCYNITITMNDLTCRPCDYFKYELVVTDTEGSNTLVMPSNDYVEFAEKPTYSQLLLLIGNMGGLL
jgi:hypothetical protein